MRVLLIVSSSRLAGTERHVVELAAGLRCLGVRAEVACEGGELASALLERAVPVHRVPLTGLHAARGLARIAGLARDADLVHAHLTEATAVAVLAGAAAGRPVVETRHFLELAHETRSQPGRWLGTVARGLLDRRVDLTLAPSRAALRAVGHDRTRLVPHGAELPPLPRTRPVGGRTFVAVGRLESDRHHDLLLRGFAAAAPGLPGSRLTIVGDGGRRGRLERLARELGVSARVRFTGHLRDPGVELARADVYVAATREAFGLATLEAMGHGLPVVGVARGGLTDLIAHGRTGLLVEPGVAELAEAMVTLGRDPARARGLGDAGRRRAGAVFPVEAMVRGTVAAYRQLVGSSKGPRVLRVYHSGVVGAWRERDREVRRLGADVTLVAPTRWPEGTREVELEPGHDPFVVSARTFGRHPNLFVYDPRPLWRAMRRQRFDVVDVHEEPCSLAAAEVRLLRRLLQPRARLLLYSAQNIPKRYPWPFRHLEAGALREADAVYPCNRAAGEILRAKGFRGEVRVLPLGVDVDRFRPRADVGPDGRCLPIGPSLRIGYVGRLEHHKGVHVLLRAVSGQAGWALDIVGSGPRAPDLVRLADELGIGEAVTFHGSVGHDQLPGLYRRLDVLVVPSLPTRRWCEQFCRVAVEAMASGVPVVASASGALPEVVGDAGLLVEPGDATALRRVLTILAADPRLRRELGARGRRRAGDYAWTAVARGHLDLYRTVMT